MRKIARSITLALMAITIGLPLAQAQEFDSRGLTFYSNEMRWVDSVMNSLSLEQKIAQLMVVRVPLDMNDYQAAEFSAKMNGYGVGGVCFFVGTAERQVAITRKLQHDAHLPLLVCLDAEWGLGMRLKDCFSFPKNAVFGRLDPQYDSLVYQVGREIGLQCREMGVHINFAPVVDINSNPKNPVIGTRSFGTDRQRVADLGIMYAKGLQSTGVIATAKHFPGHGDTDADSHYELPVINHTRAYIDSVDTYPFRQLIDAGVQGVMTAHLQVNALDPDHPSSLSPIVVDSLLRQQMGFDGLIITDGLDMKGVTNTYKDGKGELAALMAGNDILLLPPDVPAAINAIKQAARRHDNVREMVDYHCRRILLTKYRHVIPTTDQPIHTPSASHTPICRDLVSQMGFLTDRTIDSLANACIADGATPGCQVVVMHRGQVVLDRTYGRQTYDQTSLPVTPTTLYDLASLTKVSATTLAIMKLVDQGKISVTDRLSKYLPYLDSTNKRNITIEQVMSHYARLQSFCPFWKQTNDPDSLLLMVAQSPLTDKQEYLYSDLGFILLADLVKRVSGQPLDQFCATHFYKPMGLTHTTFLPLSTFSADSIAPTELDTLRGLIHGQVHDPNAFALGGVSGHAGLFSTAREVAILMQMLLDGGTYKGQTYLQKSTIDEFTRRHYGQVGNRRALGFDKPLINGGDNGPCAPEASQLSYGHSGFTGTFVWVDPEQHLVYVFLSNRVHPTATPNRLANSNVRTNIQSALYHIVDPSGTNKNGTAKFGN